MYRARIRSVMLVGLFCCGFWLPADAQWQFEYQPAPAYVLYDVSTGEGSGTASISIAESPENYGFPNPVWGFALSIGHDPTLLEPIDVAQGAAIEGINSGYGPDFWAIGIEPDGIYAGVIYSFLSNANGYYETPEEIVVVHYQTVAAAFVGDQDGENTTIFGLEVGSPPVENLVVVDVPGPNQSAVTLVMDGVVNLVPDRDMVRGDADSSGSIESLADAISVLNYLFVGSNVTCLDALDCNDDAAVDLADPIMLLTWGYAMGANLPAPFPECGADPTGDSLACDTSMCP
ncbi:MAG: hypothetical protein OSB12_01450 [Planctomycetota bacterium]|nr:hypothetical protein [Planctomycetota bacterium]